MLIIENGSMIFGEKEIFSNLSLSVKDHEKVGLVGENGAGKSSILKAIVGQIELCAGKISFSNDLFRSISYIPQHLNYSGEDNKTTIYDYMLEGRGLRTIRNQIAEIESTLSRNSNYDPKLLEKLLELKEEDYRSEGYRCDDDILNLLIGLGLSNVDLDREIATLSSGQKTRLCLARMLFEKSNLLVLDEPTNHIDAKASVWLAEYLSKSKQSMIIVSHDIKFLDRIVTRIVHINPATKSIKSYPGNYTNFLKTHSQEKKTACKQMENIQYEITRQRDFIANASQNDSGIKHSREKTVQKLEGQLSEYSKEKRRSEITFSVSCPLAKEIIRISGINKKIGDTLIFNNLSLAMQPRDRVAIVGENGAGKTTLFKVIAGELDPDKGNILRNTKLELGWYRQEQDNLDDSTTVFGQACQSQDVSDQKIRATLAHFLFPAEMLSQKVGTLSCGERARLSLCLIMLKQPNFLLLDEPTNHLDEFSRKRLISALVKYKGALLVISHDRRFLTSINIKWGISMPSGKSVILK